MDEKEPKKTNGYQIFQSSDCEDSSTDEVSTCNETDEELTQNLQQTSRQNNPPALLVLHRRGLCMTSCQLSKKTN